MRKNVIKGMGNINARMITVVSNVTMNVMTSVVLDHSMHFIVAIVCRLNSAAINMSSTIGANIV